MLRWVTSTISRKADKRVGRLAAEALQAGVIWSFETNCYLQASASLVTATDCEIAKEQIPAPRGHARVT